MKRYDVCTGAQLADLTNSLPGGDGHALKRLPDGGVLVANDAVIARLDAAGSLVQTYDVEEEPEAWRASTWPRTARPSGSPTGARATSSGSPWPTDR